MATFKYVGDDGRYYVNEGVVANYGVTHDFSTAPDFRWEPVESAEKPAEAQPAAQPETQPVTAPPAEAAQPAAEQPAAPVEGK